MPIGNLKSSIYNRDDLAADLPILDNQSSDTDRQLESPRAGAAGIEVEHTIARFLLRDMTVSVDDDLQSGGFRLQIKLGEIMQDVDGNGGKFDHFSLRQPARPRALVNVASDSGDRRDTDKPVEDLGCAHVAGMDDVSGTT